ncbi:MAG: Rieske 2Fe-2S domain-containing protein [Deltaproteobacteria bacterium]|nr:Rieske 2Fe-2S domain-containing protein [Deltaproteobacteria bacterium]
MQTGILRRNIFQRIFGICATKPPADEGCWNYENGKVIVDLSRATELSKPNGAVRLEKKNDLPARVLVFKSEDGQYHAFHNQCAHAKRRLDPIPGAQQVQCCSIGKSTFDYEGKVVSGTAEGDVRTYLLVFEDGKLVITL